MNRIFTIATGLVCGLVSIAGTFAQEVITPVMGNPQAAKYYRAATGARKSTGSAPLELPVFDDFSNSYITPDTEIWSDNDAFINNNYCIDPVSNGVATLDAVDHDGSIYPQATFDPNSFIADHLTSQSIQLDYPAADSIYFSFLYQPGGLGDMPEEQDSLSVDFYDPSDEMWINVWSIPGSDSHPFRHVMIPVADSRFLAEGFRFRFRNRASLPRNNDYPDKRANVDHWNVDYVRLGRHRFAADTVLRDVAFHTPPNSVLKDLSSLPWSHFQKAYNTVLVPSFTVRYRNNDTISRNVTRSLIILEPLYNETYNPGDPTAQDLPALRDTMVEFGYIYPIDFERGDSALIRFKAAIRTDEFDPKVNDTVTYDLELKDYYSYDDGTAEAGYGLRAQGTRNGNVAIKYHAFQPDLLGGVDISFNQLYDSLNLNYYFKLMVWDDNGGVPGSTLLEDGNDHTVVYSDHFPGFIRFRFSQPVAVDGTFYVGWKQYNEYMLNVGLDLNNRTSPQVMFYNYQGIWEMSKAPGVIMFRPFLYDETTGGETLVPATGVLHVFPNPASTLVTIEIPHKEGETDHLLKIFDAAGRLLDQEMIQNGPVDISRLPAGIYFITATSGNCLYHAKLLINR
jgi:hypothetical protein